MPQELTDRFQQQAPSLAIFSKALKKFCENEFRPGERYFSVIYGSYAYGIATPSSDVDLMIVADHVDDERMKRCIDFTIELHRQYKLQQDTEIRYEHKVLIPADFIERSLSGAGFRNQNGDFYIPEIVKTREYLDSEALRHRFLLALMAHKHAFVSGDEKYYRDLCNTARVNLVSVVSAARNESIDSPETIHKLLNENGNESGELYLGFKDNQAHQSYLAALSQEIFRTLKTLAAATANQFISSPKL